ncbi:hypothetical protein FIM1_1769 [Kluyveromyces marxianus]|uniref:Uncharacterized protein n=1 Tax=Kluyveromyces marxianus TaxID=4911 RepID=A0ABX6EXV2_KLUMA|nr:hypothetical protein FIM1_1769 [Kluyveromyces marxianus]
MRSHKKTLEKWQYSTEYNPSRVSTGICTYSEKTVVFGCLFEPLFNFQDMMILYDMHLYNKRRSLYIIAQYLYKWAKSSMLLYIYISTAVRFFLRDCSVSPIFQFSRASSLSQHPCTRHTTAGKVFLFVHHSKLFFLRDRQLAERTGVFPLLEEKLC